MLQKRSNSSINQCLSHLSSFSLMSHISRNITPRYWSISVDEAGIERVCACVCARGSASSEHWPLTCTPLPQWGRLCLLHHTASCYCAAQSTSPHISILITMHVNVFAYNRKPRSKIKIVYKRSYFGWLHHSMTTTQQYRIIMFYSFI